MKLHPVKFSVSGHALPLPCCGVVIALTRLFSPPSQVSEHVCQLPQALVTQSTGGSVGGWVGEGVGGGLHMAVLVVSMPKVQNFVPDSVNPLSQVGVHELPLARLDVHVPAAPFVGAAEASHVLGLHMAVLAVSVPAVQVLVPATVYPLLHVGVHELPCSRVAVQLPATPFVGAAEASQRKRVGLGVVGLHTNHESGSSSVDN